MDYLKISLLILSIIICIYFYFVISKKLNKKYYYREMIKYTGGMFDINIFINPYHYFKKEYFLIGYLLYLFQQLTILIIAISLGLILLDMGIPIRG